MRHIFVIAALYVALAGAATAQPSDSWYEVIAATYEQHDPALDDYLVGEVERFVAIYPGHARVPDALYCRARILEQDKQEHRALLCWLRLGLLYPDHTQAGAARDAAVRIAARQKKYADHLDTLRAAVEAPPATETADRFLAFLELVTSVMHKGLREDALPLYRLFGALHPTDPRQVRTLEWEARVLAAEGDEAAAAATLAKAQILFPEAPGVPMVMRRRARLLADELKSAEQALTVLADLRTRYPDHPAAALALRDQARIKGKTKDHAGAAMDLRAFVDTYPDHEQALDTLFELADLTEGKLKAWERTDKIYEEIVTRFSVDPRAVEALRASAKLNDKQLKNPARAATQYARVAELFPATADADKDLFKAVKLARDKLGDEAQAATYLETIISTWPDTEAARKARQKLDKLQATE